MPREFVPIKYRKAARGRAGYYFTTEKQPDGRWTPVRLLTAEESEENRQRAYQIYLAQQVNPEQPPELPRDLIITVMPPKVRLVRRPPGGAAGPPAPLEVVNETPEALEAYLASLPADQAELVRVEVVRHARWQREASPGFRVTSPTNFAELEREQEDARTAERAGRRVLGMDDTTPSAVNLEQCLEAWVDDRKADKDPYDDGYLSDVRTRFRRFMAVVGMGDNPARGLGRITDADVARGNVKLHQLKAQHFANFRLWSSRQPELGPKAHNDHMLAVGTVLRYVDSTRPDWQIPPQLLAWAAKYLKRDKYAPAEENTIPTEVDVFRKLLGTADAWAATPVPLVEKRTRHANPLFLRAEQRRRQGVVMRAVLLFKLNIAGDNVDLCRLRPDQLKNFDTHLPWVDLPRPKMRRRLGKPIPRRTPLLPSTVAALKRLRELRPDTDHVFVGEVGPFTSGGLTQAYRELADAAGVKTFTLKHLRNAGPTVATRRGIASYLVDALLGHVLPTTARFYVGWQTFVAGDLVPVVNAIGEEYLGEVVGGSGLGQA